MTDNASVLWLVYDHCGCGDPGCYGRSDFRLFESEQTAKQEAEQRSKRYGGSRLRPDMHLQQITISTTTTGF